MHASCTRRYTHRRARMHTPKHTRVRAHTYAREHTYEPIDAIGRTTHRHTGTRMHAACARRYAHSTRTHAPSRARTHYKRNLILSLTLGPSASSVRERDSERGRERGGEGERERERERERESHACTPSAPRSTPGRKVFFLSAIEAILG